MKHITILVLAMSFSIGAWSQGRFPYDSVSHKVIYYQSIRLNTQIKAREIYDASVLWFADSAEFTHQNAETPGEISKSKISNRQTEARDQYDNRRPLQMHDPEGGKIQGMGMIRYYGGSSTSIRLLYIKYDIGIRIRDGVAGISVSNIRYFHYNPGSYKQIPLYGFRGGRPCEEVGTIESLVECENFHDEFGKLALYFNQVMEHHFDNYKNLLKQKKYLYDPKASAQAKAPTKPVAKPTAKKK